MTVITALASICLGVGVWLLVPVDNSVRRLSAIQTRRAGGIDEPPDLGAVPPTPPSVLVIRLVSVMAGAATWLLLGGWFGLGLGVGVAIAGSRMLGKLESSSIRKQRQRLETAAPMVADLMAACLASGASPEAAVTAVIQALGDPVAQVLRPAIRQLKLGADPHNVWHSLTAQPELAPIARAVLRSSESGAPLAGVLKRVADDLRSQRRGSVEAMARAVGVKAVGPLGVCFLPAFMLLGVVPLIASLLQNALS